MARRRNTISAGNYVIVKDGVHDAQMPATRRDGIVLEADPKLGTAVILFSNGAILKFHMSQLSMLKTQEQYYL